MTPKPTGKVKLTETQREVLSVFVMYPDVFLRESISFWFESWDGTRNRFQYQEAVKPSTVAILKRHKLNSPPALAVGVRALEAGRKHLLGTGHQMCKTRCTQT